MGPQMDLNALAMCMIREESHAQRKRVKSKRRNFNWLRSLAQGLVSLVF